jgi:DNA polymerase III alpha subunit
MRYVELHARSAFSFLEGASLPEALIFTATQKEIPSMALPAFTWLPKRTAFALTLGQS